jgi:hypothetical protein
MKKQPFVYAGLYALIMAIATGFVPEWRVADWRFFSLLHRSSGVSVSDDVMIVDVPYNENLAVFRAGVSRLLRKLAEKPDNLPKLVVLDAWISADTSGLSGLKSAVGKLRDARVPVYAGVDPTREGKPEQLDAVYMDRHAVSFYDMLDGKGHTRFSHIAGVVHYQPSLDLPPTDIAGIQYVQALPVVLAMHHYNVPATSKPVIVNLGQIGELRQHIWTYHHNENGEASFSPFSSESKVTATSRAGAPSLRGKVVIVGSLNKDREKFEQLSGPEVLAFAISERILPKSSNRPPEILENPLLLFGMVLAFAGLSVMLFHTLYRKLPTMRNRLWVLALANTGALLMLLAAWVAGLSLLNLAYAQITLVVISIVVSTGVSWFALRRGMEEKLIALPEEQSASDGKEMTEYDVFISYARTPENSAWVRAQVYERLLRLRKADGSPVRVFFDQRNIEPGEDWYRKLALSIQGSRFFLPVYTADYFSRKFCEFEMRRAALRHVELGDFFIAIAREDVTVPTQYNHIQYLDVRTDADFMDRIVERIRKQDSGIVNGKENDQKTQTK